MVVGGSFIFAAITVFKGLRIGRRAALSAGGIVLVWLTVQVAVIGYVSWMQPATAGAGLLILVLAWHLEESASSALDVHQ